LESILKTMFSLPDDRLIREMGRFWFS